jgi:hypothetical protein
MPSYDFCSMRSLCSSIVDTKEAILHLIASICRLALTGQRSMLSTKTLVHLLQLWEYDVDSSAAMLNQLCYSIPKTIGIELVMDILDSLITSASSHKKTLTHCIKAFTQAIRQSENGSATLRFFNMLLDRVIIEHQASSSFIIEDILFTALSDLMKDIMHHTTTLQFQSL